MYGHGHEECANVHVDMRARMGRAVGTEMCSDECLDMCSDMCFGLRSIMYLGVCV